MSDGEESTPNQTAASTARLLDKLPPNIRTIVNDYCVVTKSLLSAPVIFYREMEKEGGFKHAVIYLAISSGVSSLIAGVVTFHPLSIPATLATSMMLTFAAAGVAFGLARAMGGKGTYEATFKVYAYASCLSILSAVPLANLLAIFWGAALNFYGLKEVQQVGTLRTATIILLTSMLMTVLAVAHYLHVF